MYEKAILLHALNGMSINLKADKLILKGITYFNSVINYSKIA